MQTDNFLGYTSKKDGQVDNLGMASDCNNVVINKGDLCNFPYPQKRFTLLPAVPIPSDKTRVWGFYYFKGIRSLISIRPPVGLTFQVLVIDVIPNINIDPEVADGLGGQSPERIYLFSPEIDGTNEDYTSNPLRGINGFHGNYVQVGEWGYILQQLDYISPEKAVPRLTRFKVTKDEDAPVTAPFRFNIEPVGIKAPFFMDLNPTTLAEDQGDYDTWGNTKYEIGFTFVSNIFGRTKSGHDGLNDLPEDFDSSIHETDGSDWISVTDTNDLESNGIVWGVSTDFDTTKPRVRLYMHPDYTEEAFNKQYLVGCYTRNITISQTEFYFIGYIKPFWAQSGIETGVEHNNRTYDLRYVDFYVNIPPPTTTQDFDKTIPATGVTGPIINSHNVPRAAVHATFYKRKMYYQSLPSEEWHEGFSENTKNRLEVSMATPDGEDETGKYANYIEAEEFIGLPHESGCGLVEYLDQLIMFKETETHVLTGDILDPSTQRRILFSKIGGINTHGGKAYIVIDEILYWASIDYKIWRYDGGSAPTVISTIIEEDLRAIDKDRYRLMRVSQDPLNKLMIISFPKGKATKVAANKNEVIDYPEFIYHYDENGKWTKSKGLDIQQLLLDNEKNIYKVGHTDIIEVLDSVDKRTILPFNDYEMHWESTKITNGNIGKNKHYKGIKVLTVEDYQVKPFVRVGGLPKKPKELQYNEYITLDRHGKKHNIELNFLGRNNIVKGQPFRINGLELDVHTVGGK